MAYPARLPHINRKKLPSAKAYRVSDRRPILEKNMASGWDPLPPGWEPPSSGPQPPMGGMMGIGGMNPWALGASIAVPAGIAAYKWWNSGPAPPEPTHGRPGDPPHPDDGYFKQAGDLFTGKLLDQMIGEPWPSPYQD